MCELYGRLYSFICFNAESKWSGFSVAGLSVTGFSACCNNNVNQPVSRDKEANIVCDATTSELSRCVIVDR